MARMTWRVAAARHVASAPMNSKGPTASPDWVWAYASADWIVVAGTAGGEAVRRGA